MDSFEQLNIKVEALGEMVMQLLAERASETADTAASSSGPANQSKYDSESPGTLVEINKRLKRLEHYEEEHSRLLVLKAKADGKMCDDFGKLKEEVAIISGKVDYCLRELEDSEGDLEEGEDEEEEKRMMMKMVKKAVAHAHKA